MRRSIRLVLTTLLAGGAVSASAAAAPDKATYVTKEEIETVAKAYPNGDRNVKVVDIGHENFAVGIVHRGKTVNGQQLGPRTSAPLPPAAPEPCGRKMDQAPSGGRAGGITHDSQAEGYYITSGEGTMFTDGYIVNGRKLDLADLNGPTCLGVAYGTVVKAVKTGDVVIIPPGVVHGWLDIPDHVDYLSFRPSPGVLEAGWTSPALKPK
jgi:hypothetical protein